MLQKLFYSIRNNDLQSVKAILQREPDLIQARDERGSTPLLLAAYYGHDELTQYLLTLNPVIDEKDASGSTALMGSCFKGHLSVVKLLIDAGANVNEANESGGTALFFAAMFN